MASVYAECIAIQFHTNETTYIEPYLTSFIEVHIMYLYNQHPRPSICLRNADTINNLQYNKCFVLCFR